ncbi:MAG: LacI family DNA-binding transcriptional regulator [Oscillospiraceae bacterium]|nr:LacI family DNA-binding transcriptional regulator [Oscillospiraceae bacterium]
MNSSKNVTISDIARAAGVSKTTVSRYLNGKFSMMSPETRSRIETVIRMTNYQPNSLAQSLRGHRSMQIGIVISDLVSPFCAAMIRGMGQPLLEAGFIPLIVDSKEDPALEARLIQTLMSRKVDGLIVNTSSYVNPDLIRIACEGVPVVLCDRYISDYRFAFVGSVHRSPITRLVAHLKEEGFGKIGFFTQEYRGNSTRFIRRDAFARALAEHYPGDDSEELTFVLDLTDQSGTIRCVEKLLASCPGGVPAIIAVNSATTMHLLGAIRAMGLTMPRDIGLCGPDDWGWDQQYSMSPLNYPGITSFTVHPAEIGALAAETLLNMIREPDREKRDILLPSELLIRDSTRLRASREEEA